jgi:hypothetical protein
VNADRTQLAAGCERALIDGARAERAGSRQRVRAAARRFVRRHARDAAYLRFVLRSVAASSALAAALLGLGAQPAQAKLPPMRGPVATSANAPGTRSSSAGADLDSNGATDLLIGRGDGTFVLQTRFTPVFDVFAGSIDLLPGQDVGAAAMPALGDLDGDGDFDLVSGAQNGALFYFENTGSPTAAAFAARTGSANPLNGQTLGTYSAPALGDLDADGDLDLVAGSTAGTFAYFENTGTATSPAFVARTGAANPLNGQDVGGVSTPTLGDLDQDGDLDVVSGEDTGVFNVFENTGSATSAVFVARTGTANPLAGEDEGIHSTPTFLDLDADGDPDLLVGEFNGGFSRYDNLGGLVSPAVTSIPNTLPAYSSPTLGDLDGDADVDILVGTSSGDLRYFENTGSITSPAFVARTGAANPLNGVDVGSRSRPAFVDIDADQDLDLFVGEFTGPFSYFENTGSKTTPAFVLRPSHPLNEGDLSQIFYTEANVAFGDIDADGDLDAFFGMDEIVFFLWNHGSASEAHFTFIQGSLNPLQVGFPFAANLALGDVDGDRDLDAVVGEGSGDFLYFENTGTVTDAQFVQHTSTSNLANLNLFQHPTIATGVVPYPALGDLDGDGDLDLVSGNAAAVTLVHFESFIRQHPRATRQIGSANPLDGRDVGSLSAPALADLDGDGDADVVAGETGGTFSFFENTQSATNPKYVPRTGVTNPLNGRDVGSDARPALGDLDGDGDFDLLAGNLAGGFDYFANTGDAEQPQFAAGVANPFGIAGVASTNSAPTLGDVDSDGDLDLLVGAYYSAYVYFENTGSRTSPAFVERDDGTLSGNPFEDLDLSYYAAPALGDFDADGDLDLFAGTEAGRFVYFENLGERVHPKFVRYPGPQSPLFGEDLGNRASPAAADLNGDGHLDLVAGAADGTFAVYFLPEPGQGALLGAGLALLAWLDRLRGRRRR